jgi:hypothetical protein
MPVWNMDCEPLLEGTRRLCHGVWAVRLRKAHFQRGAGQIVGQPVIEISTETERRNDLCIGSKSKSQEN